MSGGDRLYIWAIAMFIVSVIYMKFDEYVWWGIYLSSCIIGIVIVVHLDKKGI